MKQNGHKRNGHKRDYSSDDKAVALALLVANGGNVLRTAKELNMPEPTLRDWATGQVNDVVRGKQDEKRRALGDLFEQCSRLYLDRAMTDAAIEDTKGKDAVIAAATAFDKQQLARGEATNITKDVSERTHEDRANRILELVKPSKAA